MKRLQNEDAICYSVETADDILIHTSGSIHEDTFSHKQQERKVITAENTAVADCGAAIYDALDYGLTANQQRTLSMDLEEMVDNMISAEEEEEDEGIGEDVGIKKTGLSSDLMEICRTRLSVRREADSHYKSVCRYESFISSRD